MLINAKIKMVSESTPVTYTLIMLTDLSIDGDPGSVVLSWHQGPSLLLIAHLKATANIKTITRKEFF